MISSEAVPFAKSGGLADVVTALSQNLVQTGHDVRIMIPCYQTLIGNGYEILPWTGDITIGGREEQFRVARTSIQGVEVYLFMHPLFSERKGIYGPTSNTPYPDNLYRFTLFSYGVFEFCRLLAWYPDLFHCHDWTTGFIPLILKKLRKEYPVRYSSARSIMTIHNLGYQGDFSKHDIHVTGFDATDIQDTPFEYSDRINMLKTGIQYCDTITTVSNTYANEIQTPEFGCGLEGLLTSRSSDLFGITNGVDYTEWDPSDDAYLPLHFSIDDISNKALLKKDLQSQARLPQKPNVPLIGMVSRIADQKGFRELCGGLPSVLERALYDFQVQFVIVGTGDTEIERYLEDLAKRYENLSVYITFNNYIAHLVEAGADFFLMPSRYEPCGLNQIYSLKYGTIPIVRKTGGLADTIEPISSDLSEGTGILFEHMSGEAIYQSIAQAVSMWEDFGTDRIREVRLRGMSREFSWELAAKEYEFVYMETLKKGVTL